MMANWDLEALARDLPKLTAQVALIAARGDKAVAPEAADKAKARLRDARVEFLPGVGHLAHEERPELVAERIFALSGV